MNHPLSYCTKFAHTYDSMLQIVERKDALVFSSQNASVANLGIMEKTAH